MDGGREGGEESDGGGGSGGREGDGDGAASAGSQVEAALQQAEATGAELAAAAGSDGDRKRQEVCAFLCARARGCARARARVRACVGACVRGVVVCVCGGGSTVR